MRAQIKYFLAFVLLAIGPGCSNSRLAALHHAPSKEQTGAFITLYGTDTASIERFSRSASSTSASLVINRLSQMDFILVITPEQRVAELRRKSSSYEEKTPADTLYCSPDSLSASKRKPWAVLPYIDRSTVLLEQVVRFAQLQPGPNVKVRLFRTIPQQSVVALVHFATLRRVQVDLQGMHYEIQLDKRGSIEAASLPAYGVRIQRVASLRASAYRLEPLLDAPTGAPYTATEVRVPARAGHVLAGTLTLPQGGENRKAVVVLITGSGQNNRNNGGSPSVPFRQIADGLSRRGVAVLRLDDRGTGASTGDWKTATMQQEANDIEDAIVWLRKRADINPRRVGLLGLSEGGIIAPMLGARDPSLAAIATMAGVGGTGREMAQYQIRYAVDHMPSIPPAQRDSITAHEVAEQFIGPPKIKSIVEYNDALATAQRLKMPLLILHGANDRHIPPAHAQQLANAARAGGNEAVTVQVFPGLNHVFLPDPDGSSGIRWAYLPTFTLPTAVMESITNFFVKYLLAKDG